MTLADSLRAILPGIRAIPGNLGLRLHRVFILDASFSGGHTGAGTKTETETEITHANNQPPLVRWLNDEELALANLGGGIVEIGPITPPLDPADGSLLSLLIGSDLENGETHKIRIVGPMHPNGSTYIVVGRRADRALRYMIRARPVDQQVG